MRLPLQDAGIDERENRRVPESLELAGGLRETPTLLLRGSRYIENYQLTRSEIFQSFRLPLPAVGSADHEVAFRVPVYAYPVGHFLTEGSVLEVRQYGFLP